MRAGTRFFSLDSVEKIVAKNSYGFALQVRFSDSCGDDAIAVQLSANDVHELRDAIQHALSTGDKGE